MIGPNIMPTIMKGCQPHITRPAACSCWASAGSAVASKISEVTNAVRGFACARIVSVEEHSSKHSTTSQKVEMMVFGGGPSLRRTNARLCPRHLIPLFDGAWKRAAFRSKSGSLAIFAAMRPDQALSPHKRNPEHYSGFVSRVPQLRLF